MNDKSHVAEITSELTYTVDNLTSRLLSLVQTELWKKVSLLVRVEGKTAKINTKSYYGFSYFNLIGEGTELKIKCPSKFLPKENTNIIIEGAVTFKSNKFNNCIEMELEGKPVGQVGQVEQVADIIEHEEIKKKSHLKLVQFLEKSSLDKLLFLGTETGLKDTFSAIDFNCNNQIKSKEITTYDNDKILTELYNLDSSIEAFVIVRGGDDTSLTIWDDASFVKELVDLNIPFYVALGHTHRIMYVCQYADESFNTPASLGHAITVILTRQNQLSDLQIKVDALVKDNHVLTEKNNGKIKQLKSKNYGLQKSIKELKNNKTSEHSEYGEEYLSTKAKKIIAVLFVVIFVMALFL